MIRFPKPDVEQYFQTYLIRQFTVSADESRIVFSSNMNGHFNLWAVDLNGDTLFPYPLTYCNQASDFIAVDPEERYILTGFDHDGNENYHIHALPPSGGAPLALIEAGENDKMFFVRLSEDGERMYYSTSRGNPNFLNSRCYNLLTQEDELILEGTGTLTNLDDISPNGQRFVYAKSYGNTYRVNYVRTETDDLCLTPSADAVHISGDASFIDDDTIVFLTDYDAEYAYVAQYHIPTRQFTEVCRIPQESAKILKWNKKNRSLYLVTEKGVEDRLYLIHYDSRQCTQLPLPVAVVDQLQSARSGNLYVLGRSASSPANIYKYEQGAWKSLTRNVVTGLAHEQLVEPVVVTYRSYDGMEIEALLFRAKEEQANGYTIFWPHGGPQAAERKQFRSMFQYFLAQGYHVFAPNFRGSTGYGSAFTKMVECDWGEGPRLDCVAAMDWLFEQGISSKERLFVVGGSYGGYMTLLLHGRHADYFRAAVDIFGVSNLFTFYNSVPDHWKPLMERWVGDPERDKERFIYDSPITYLDGMTNPMLVIQGANDPRVVKEESDQIVQALKDKGRDVEYIVLDDEGHGFSKKVNEMRVYRAMVEFLQRHHE